MGHKLLFFDIDGTLVGFDQKMPASTRDALFRAKENGHRLFLCTGRCRTQIYPWLLADFPFDGLVMCAGANVYVGDKQIFHRTFGSEKMKALLGFLEESKASYLIQNEYGVMMTQRCLESEARIMSGFLGGHVTGDHFREAFEKILGKLTLDDTIASEPEKFGDMETVIYHGSPLTVAQMQEKFEPLGIKVTEASIQKPSPHDGEVTVLGVTKREGMQAVEQYYGLTRADTIAFGDGANDLPMLEYAGVGVCMGNGAESAKARADLITDDIAEDGLLHAMERLGLI